MSLRFTHRGLPLRVRFGAGSVGSVPAEVRAVGGSRVLIVATPGRADTARAIAASLPAADVYAEAVGHVPVELGAAAVDRARTDGADTCVAVGGGAAIGLAKIIARDLGLPIVAVPTTYSGSEMTPVWGETRDGRKHTAADERVLAKSVVYDPDLTRTLPPSVAAASGMNAIAHAAEALYAPDASPLTTLGAREGIRVLAGALPEVVNDPASDSWDRALYGAWLCGWSLSGTTMGFHHKLAHVLGGSFGLPHAPAHAVVLPYTFAYNAAAAPDAAAVLGEALGAAPAAAGLWDLNQRLGLPTSLAELGFGADDIDAAARLATTAAFPNPRAVTEAGVGEVLHAAHAGTRPS